MGLPTSYLGPVWILKPIPSVLGRAKNLIQAVLLIPGKPLISCSIYFLEGNWRGGEEAWSYAGACVVFWLGVFFAVVFVGSFVFPSYKVWKLALHPWSRRTRQCSVTCQHQIDLVLNEGDAWALGQGALRVLCSIPSMLGCGRPEPSQACLWL